VQHEAQIVALLADVIHREAFEYWDDETFAGYATDQRQSAADVAAAAASDNYDQAREAIGRATNACTNCHDGYRG
jgi:cytochrome c556